MRKRRCAICHLMTSRVPGGPPIKRVRNVVEIFSWSTNISTQKIENKNSNFHVPPLLLHAP
jgi:hypothetical protein